MNPVNSSGTSYVPKELRCFRYVTFLVYTVEWRGCDGAGIHVHAYSVKVNIDICAHIYGNIISVIVITFLQLNICNILIIKYL